MAEEWITGQPSDSGSGTSAEDAARETAAAGSGAFSSGSTASAASAAGSESAAEGSRFAGPGGTSYSAEASAGGPLPPGGAASSTGTSAGAQGTASPGWNPVGSSYAPPPTAATAPPPATGGGAPPNPVAAGLLGLIPGVGAMYNGQYAKGMVHLLIFAALVSLANNVSEIFGMMVAAWIFYQAFEAYHTARARLDGLPLPDPFGWNDIGERLGFGRTWPGSAARPPSTRMSDWRPWGAPSAWSGSAPGSPSGAVPGSPTGNPGPDLAPTEAPTTSGFPAWGQPAPNPQPFAPYAPSPYPPPANWAGYVAPSAFAGMQPGPPVPPSYTPASASPLEGASAPLPGQAVPYSSVSMGSGYPPLDPGPGPRRFPAGALWLIGLGVLFLLGQWTPLFRLSHEWVPTILLAGLAVWIFARRMGWTGTADAQRVSGVPENLRVAAAVRAPGMLLATALLLGVQAAGLVPLRRSWPWFLIALGGVLLLERILSRPALPNSGEADAADTKSKGGLL